MKHLILIALVYFGNHEVQAAGSISRQSLVREAVEESRALAQLYIHVTKSSEGRGCLTSTSQLVSAMNGDGSRFEGLLQILKRSNLTEKELTDLKQNLLEISTGRKLIEDAIRNNQCKVTE